MKKIAKPAMFIALFSVAFAQTGCFGEFALTRKAYNWHDGVSDSKFVKSVLLWIPMGIVYSVTTMIDVVILNLIEFWSGSNPLSMNEGEHEMQLATIHGEQFRIEATKDTFITTQLTGTKAGEVRIMRFDRDSRTWKYTDSRVCDQPVLTILDDQADNVRLYTEQGTVDLTSADLCDASVLSAKFDACTTEMASTR